MIFDRTSDDVQNAINIVREKVQKQEELTENDVAILEKGMLTYNCINRIEEMINKTWKCLYSESYMLPILLTEIFDENSVFTIKHFNRIINNIEEIRKAFFVKEDTPLTPIPSYHFETLNSIEKILYDIDEIIESMLTYQRECGDFECGEEY